MRIKKTWTLLHVVICTLLISACTPSSVGNNERQLRELKGEVEALKSEKKHLLEDNQQLREKVAVQASRHPGGLVVEEERKLLAKRQANLSNEESKLAKAKEKLKQREEVVLQKEAEFFKETKMTLIDIGEAKQLKEEYEYMRKEKETAIYRNHVGLIAFAVLLVFLMICIVALPVLLMKYSAKSKQIEAAMVVAKRLPVKERELLSQTFCRPMISSSSSGLNDENQHH